MWAGVGGIDVVMRVIAADEGVMPQTREHLHICQLLGIRRGLVALTKKDLVEPEWLDLVQEGVPTFLTGTCLEEGPALPPPSLPSRARVSVNSAMRSLAMPPRSSRGEGMESSAFPLTASLPSVASAP